jgi:hypothetical protein
MVHALKERMLHYSWDLAFGFFDGRTLTEGLSAVDYCFVINPYKKEKWFADPFIYRDNDNTLELFVEEFDYSVGRGRIGHLVISKKNRRIEKLSIILEKDTHLSFPAIYRIGDDVFVHPENSASGHSVMYRYDEGHDKLVDPVVILEEPVTDAIIQQLNDGTYKMYATKVPAPNGNELFIYTSESFMGPYIPQGSFVFEKAVARMAGALIKTTNGDLIRPAQDCTNGDYGKAVHFMLGDRILTTLLPPTRKYAGLHTFNVLGNSYIVDLKRYDYPWLYRIKTGLKR